MPTKIGAVSSVLSRYAWKLKNANLCKKHQRWTILFWFVTVPNVLFCCYHLELCSCYWFICRNPLAIVFCNSRNYERTGFVHPNSPIRQSSNECFDQSIINNLPNTVVFAQYMWLFHPNSNAVGKSTVSISTRFVPVNDCVLFALVKLGNSRVYGSSPIFTFKAVNATMRKGCGHLFG